MPEQVVPVLLEAAWQQHCLWWLSDEFAARVRTIGQQRQQKSQSLRTNEPSGDAIPPGQAYCVAGVLGTELSSWRLVLALVSQLPMRKVSRVFRAPESHAQGLVAAPPSDVRARGTIDNTVDEYRIYSVACKCAEYSLPPVANDGA